MKQLLFVLVLVLCFFNAKAQLEIKANLLPLLGSKGELSSEYIFAKKIGLEAGIGIYWHRSEASPPFDTTNMAPTEKLVLRQLNYYLNGKYYFSPKKGGDRFYVGVMYHHKTYIFYEKNDQPAKKPADINGVGVEPGYKWVIKNKFIADIGLRLLYSRDSYEIYNQVNRIFEIDLILNGKLGYRF